MLNTGLMVRRDDRGFLIVIKHTQINFSNEKMKRFLNTPENEPNASSSALIQGALGSYQTLPPLFGKEGFYLPERPTSEVQLPLIFPLSLRRTC
jgi:hypothetical protein